jgi:hypothetical protein
MSRKAPVEVCGGHGPVARVACKVACVLQDEELLSGRKRKGGKKECKKVSAQREEGRKGRGGGAEQKEREERKGERERENREKEGYLSEVGGFLVDKPASPEEQVGEMGWQPPHRKLLTARRKRKENTVRHACETAGERQESEGKR